MRDQKEGQVYMQELDTLVQVKLVDDSMAVLSLGMLCVGMDHSCSWKTGEHLQLTQNGVTVCFIAAVTKLGHDISSKAGGDSILEWLRRFTEGLPNMDAMRVEFKAEDEGVKEPLQKCFEI